MAMEVKKVYYRKKKRGKTHPIDHIPKCFQLPRSASTSKPRTEFFLPICSSKVNSSKETQSSDTLGSSDTSNDTIKRFTYTSSRRSTAPETITQEILTNGIQKAHLQPCNNRNDEDRDDTLEHTPNRSQLTESNEVCVTPGSVVWVKTDDKCWWPAQILGDKSSRKRSTNDVLVRYFGKHSSVWVDPATHLSSFEECFEERSCNQAKEFQNALKQALNYKEHPRSHKDSSFCPEGPEKGNPLSSRSKRERKRKVHFDEVTCPLYTSRKVRRFKIMRSLGLAAPVGSPFNSS